MIKKDWWKIGLVASTFLLRVIPGSEYPWLATVPFAVIMGITMISFREVVSLVVGMLLVTPLIMVFQSGFWHISVIATAIAGLLIFKGKRLWLIITGLETLVVLGAFALGSLWIAGVATALVFLAVVIAKKIHILNAGNMVGWAFVFALITTWGGPGLLLTTGLLLPVGALVVRADT